MKKVVSLLLVVVLALGMSTMAFAKVTGIALDSTGKIDGDLMANSADVKGAPTDWAVTRPGAEVFIRVYASDFQSNSGTAGTTNSLAPQLSTQQEVTGRSWLIKSDVSSGKITLRTKIAKGSNVIDEVVWDYKNKFGVNASSASIKVVFIDPFVNNDTDGQDYDFDVYFAVDGTRYEDYCANFVGTLVNSTVGTIDADTDYVNLEGGRIVEVDEYSKNVEYYLGQGVSIFGKAFKDKDYYGYCDVDTTSAQESIIDKYNFDEVYNVKTVGLQSVCDYVVIADADSDSYVYNADLKYLGQAKENLEYSSVYYLSSKKLDIDEDIDDEPSDEDDDDDDDFPEAPPVTGGDDDDIANSNYNPSTGA